MTKSCGSCRHLDWQLGEPVCGRYKPARFNLIYGRTGEDALCQFQRGRFWRWLGMDTCGPHGRYWEAREEA